MKTAMTDRFLTGRSLTFRSRATMTALVSVVALAVGATACSSDDGGSPASSTVAPVDPMDAITPNTTGDGCDDPMGDIGAVAGETIEQGTMSEPAGIDIVRADAKVTDTTLDVEFEMAGPVEVVPNNGLVVAQGQPYQPASFEIRVAREALGPFEVQHVSWETGDETRTLIAVTPTLEGNTISFSVPLGLLPPLANYLAFGASADVGAPLGVVFDECSSIATSGSTDGSPSTESTD